MSFSLLGGTLTVLTLFIGVTLFQGVFTKDTIKNNNDNGNKDYEEDYISDDGRYQEFSAGKGERGLFPNIFNLATHADIRSTATCGQHNPEYYCKLVEHVFARAPQCDICDANNHLKNHPIEYAIDGTPRWWQSPSLGNGLSYEKVNITLDLRQEYQIAYVIIKAGNAPRPGTWVLEKSLDGINYSPWQYYATSDAQCMKAFGVPASHGVPKFSTDDEVICTSFYSRLDPLDNGEIHTSLVNGRPSAEHPTQILQNFTRARFVRIRLLSLRTLNADLMIINNRDQKLDQSVTRRYFYSIKDISIGGQCICYGHAESCPPEEVHGQFRCECRHNTCGESCNQCCPLYNQLPWQPGTHAQPNVCQACQCFNHADECVYDESVAIQKLSVTPDGIYEGGGKCIDCRDNTEGINCEKCKYGFYRPSNISHYQNDACHACNCDTLGSEHNECVRDETAAFNGHRPGDCICKPGFGGRRCEKCAPGYRNYPICEPCPCNPSGSLNFDTCEEENCICKSNVEGKFCDQCKPGTIFLNQNNPQGCQPCFCFGKSTDCKEGNWAVGKISSSQSWNLTGLHNYNENVVPQTNSSELLIFTSSDFERENSLFYWKAPPPFSGNLLNSYGGDLHYYVYFVPQRDSGHPTPVADVIIEGNGIRLEHYSRINFFPRENISVTIPILERQGWYNSQTRQPIDKSDLMRALSDVKYFLIRARYNQEQLQSSIYGLTLETAIPTSNKDDGKDETTPAANKAEILKFEDYKMNGVEICECPEHFTGNSCEKCEDGFRRVHNQLYGGRCEKCNCEGHSGECDPFTGSCLNCKHNTTGPKCEQCRQGFYGNPLLGGELGACKPCACPTLDNNHSIQCALSQIALEGAAAADQGEYVCTACETGYDGNKCEVCADGYFGDPTSFNGTCQPCSCNGNIDPAAIGNCDPSTGECLRCIGHTTGESCEKCEENHWGSALDKTCRACGCHRVGSISLQCSNTTGLCECNENYIGDRCDSCVSGHGDVENGCPSCDCDLTGSTGTSCNQVSGQCSCKSGVYGKRCDMCIPSYYNFTEQGCNFCHCDEYGSIDQKCSNTTGECECRPNVEGTRCDHCTPGFFNITSYQGCQECQCNELGSSSHECNVITGQCVCKDGVSGIKCDKCEPNHWGLDENGCKQCQICPAPGQVCDPVTGECVCPPNTIGEKCEACTKNSWNYDAYRGCELCDCNGVGADSSECDAQTGQCKCLPGFVGHKCDRCEAGYFNFPNCEPCNCDLNGTDPMECRDNLCLCSNEGQCKCKTHSTGLKCDQCDANSFSLDHTNPKGCTECFCFNRTNFCVQNSLVWQQVYANDRRVFFEEPFEYFDRNNLNIQILKESPQNYNSYLTNHAPLYWPLTKSFLGDKTLSYNGYLRFKIWNEDNYRQNHGVRPQPTTFKLHPQVILMGNDRIILEHTADEISDDNKYKVRIHESKWRNKISPQLPVSRQQLMVALQNLQGIYIRGTYNDMYRGDAISLRDVSLDVAVENVTDNESQSTAIGVELCGECPKGYSGASCQNPAEGYCRKRIPDYLNNPDDLALVGYATPCACNGHSTTCDPETCRCSNCQHNTMGDFCEICKAGYHGDAKEGSIDSCTKCACPLASNSFSDTCIPAETGRGYACNACKPGYAGIYCESCVAGYYGDPNIDGGFCAQCACHPYGSLNGYCHNVTGQCECRDGVEGRDCSVCRPRHAFIDRVCTSCDQGCYKDLMDLEDQMFAQLETVKNLSDSKPIPNKRLRNINEAVTSFSALLSTVKQNEESAADLFSNPIEENKNIKEARLVINEAKYLEERSNDTLNKLRKLQNDITVIRNIEHEQNRRVYDISTQLNSFSDQVSRQHTGNVEAMVSEASTLLDQLKERERQIEKQINYASKNAEEAEEILKRVLSKKLNDTSYDMLFEAHEDRRQWIKDFRDTIWDNAKVNATAAKKLTDVVNKRLETLKDLVAQVENATEGQKEILAKAKETVESIKQQSLNSHDHYQEVKDDTLTKLNKATENIRERSVKEQEELANEKHKLHAAENHAKELEHQTKKFKIEMANIQSGSNEALSAINAYKDIVQALTNASEAADQARKQAEEAFTDINGDSENSLVSEAAKKLNTSNFLKNAFAEATGSDVSDTTKRLHAVLERIQKSSTEIEKEVKSVKDAQDVLDDHEDRINNIHVTVAQANEAVENSAKTVDRFAKDVDELKDRADAVSNFNEQAIREDINNITESSQALSTTMSKLEDIRNRGAKHSDELKTVRQKLAVLKEKINEAKEKASKVRISVKSDPRTACARQYISPAHPSPTTTISIQYRPALEIPDALLFLTLTKSRRTQAREYIAIELKERRIIVHWNIGSGSRRATNSHNINHIAASDRYTWYHIDVTRIGNAVKVAVGLKQQSLGEGAKNVDEPTEVSLGEPDATNDVILNTIPGETKIYIGYDDVEVTNELGLGTNKFAGVIGGLKVDNQPVPLWVFVDQTGQCDGAIGAPQTAARGHFFRNGFAQIRMPMTERVNTLIRIVYSAYSRDGLLYFRGSSEHGDFVAVELRDGAIYVKANYGENSYVEAHTSLSTYSDGRVHAIKITRNQNEIDLQVDDDSDHVTAAIPGENNVLNVGDEDAHYVGGIPSDFDKTPFEERDISWSGFVGCIQLIKPNQVSELDLDHPIRSQRKEPGCEFKDAQLLPADGVIGFPKPGYLVTESIKLGTNSSLAFNMRTKNSNAVLLYQKALKKKGERATDEDEKTFFVFYIFNGRLIVHLGTDHSDRLKRPSLSSNQSYNDGRLHSVFFARNGNSIEVRIDDREILKGHLPDDTIIGTENSKLYFGGLPDWASKEKKDDMGTSEPLIGCLSDFYFNFEKWSIIPEEHHAQLGTCAFDDDITTETDESPADEQKSFERKNSKLSVQRAAPTFVSSSSSDSPESAALLSSFDQNLVGAIPLTETCRAPSMKETEAQIAEGARYGATESSHSKINFASPYPDFKSFKLDFLFRTESPNGTLWVWANYKKYTLYFFLYLEDGFLTLDVKGKDTAVKQLQYKERKLNDGEWHAVDFRKQEHEIQLQVDNLAVETLKDVPHPRVTRKRMFIGGVISRHKKEFNFTRPSFNGCIKDFVVDGISRDLHAKSRDVILCKNTNDVAYIHHGGYASFSALKSFSNTEPNTIEISFKLRSTTNTGLLFALLSQQEYNTTYLFANMTSESIIFTAVHSDKKLFIEHKVPLSSSLCPSEFHRFHLTLTRTNLHIRLNDARGNLQVSIPSTSMDIYRSLPIHIAGVSAKVGDSLHLSSFNGCIKDLYFSGTVVPLSKAKKLHKIIPNGCPLI